MVEMRLIEARVHMSVYCNDAGCDGSSSVTVRVDPDRRWEELEAWWQELEKLGWRRLSCRLRYGTNYDIFCPRCEPRDGLTWRKAGAPRWCDFVAIGIED